MLHPRYLALLCVLLAVAGCSARRNTGDTPSGLRVHCGAGVDTDLDGLSDACEAALARVFAPLLRTAPRACAEVVRARALPPGGYLFGVQPLSSDTVRIVYLPAYHEDCGWRGFKCSLGLTSCRGHSGDSEVIALDVVRRPHGWETSALFLSAHCFGRSDANCRWYEGGALDELAWVDASRGAPVVWVAEGKNANYPSRAACDAGHWFYDTCDHNERAGRFPVDPRRNVGSAAVPIGGDGCVTRDELEGVWSGASQERRDGTRTEPAAQECFWSDVPFTGWRRPDNGGATPYARYLRMLFRHQTSPARLQPVPSKRSPRSSAASSAEPQGPLPDCALPGWTPAGKFPLV